MSLALALVVPAYLLGTFPTALLVARAGGRDVLREGSGNPGASNVYRLMGRRAALLVFAGDFAKGAVPAAAGLAAWGHAGAWALGAAAVLGHVFPVTRRFRGGRGVATAAGLVAVVYPFVAAGSAVVWVVVALVMHYPSVASMLVAAAVPFLLWATGEPGPEVAVVGALSALVLVRHAANLRRLVRGEELAIDADDGPGHGTHEAA